jgi:tRNA (guanine37-N1)-methyltransferase
MRFDIVTIFSEFFDGPLDYGILRRARATGLVEVHVEDLRDYTHDKHRTVDDRPFGGGEGMVMKPEPLFEAVETIIGVKPVSSLSKKPAKVSTAANTAVVLLSASGKMFTEQVARRLSKLERVVLICGRYEGVDERVAEHLATDEISIGDFVLSGGELPAAMILDAVTRLIPGALGNEDSIVNESFSEPAVAIARNKTAAPGLASNHAAAASDESRITNHGILDYPHYTRPPSFRGWDVPEVLLGGNHEEIRKWRRRCALEKTWRNRPELLDGTGLGAEDRRLLGEITSGVRNTR